MFAMQPHGRMVIRARLALPLLAVNIDTHIIV